MARQPVRQPPREQGAPHASLAPVEPHLRSEPPDALGLRPPDAATVAGRDVWLVHAWRLGALPAGLPAGTLVIGLLVADFHRAWPWSDRRWRFVGDRMAELAAECWYGDAAAVGAGLQGARSVRSIDELHLAPWLARWAECEAAPALFPPVDRQCDAFSPWWARVSRGLDSAEALLAVNAVAAS
ncbi:MAG: hypothetical protein OEU93_07690 [Rubrivivax sp.]|nr:hypothetical protein [Rubrivivax sp.]